MINYPSDSNRNVILVITIIYWHFCADNTQIMIICARHVFAGKVFMINYRFDMVYEM